MKARVGRPRPVFDTKGRPCPGPCLKARAGFNPARVSQLAASPLHHCCISSLPLLFSTAASLLLQSSLLLCTAAPLLQRSLQQRCNSSAAIVSSPLHRCTSSACLSSNAATLLLQSSLLLCTAASPIQLITLRRELSGILVRARCVSSTVWFTVVLGHQRRWCLSSSSKKFLLLKTGAYY